MGQVGNRLPSCGGLLTRLPKLAKRGYSAGCQPARRIPSCPTTSAEHRHILRDSINLVENRIIECQGNLALNFGDENMRRSNVALRLQPSLLDEAWRVAESEGVALNQLIDVAVAEKLSALRTDDYLRERAAGANIEKAKRILKRAGKGKATVAGDEF